MKLCWQFQASLIYRIIGNIDRVSLLADITVLFYETIIPVEKRGGGRTIMKKFTLWTLSKYGDMHNDMTKTSVASDPRFI